MSTVQRVGVHGLSAMFMTWSSTQRRLGHSRYGKQAGACHATYRGMEGRQGLCNDVPHHSSVHDGRQRLGKHISVVDAVRVEIIGMKERRGIQPWWQVDVLSSTRCRRCRCQLLLLLVVVFGERSPFLNRTGVQLAVRELLVDQVGNKVFLVLAIHARAVTQEPLKHKALDSLVGGYQIGLPRPWG